MDTSIHGLGEEIDAIVQGYEAILPGHEVEQRVVETIARFLDGLRGANYSIEEVLVKSWEPIRANIELCGETLEATPWPRCGDGYIEIEAVPIGLSEALSHSGSLAGYAIVAPFTSPSSARSLYSRLADREPSSLILHSEHDNLLALTEKPFTITNLCATRTPVIHVATRLVERVKRCGRLRLIIQDKRFWATSAILEAWNNHSGPVVLIATSLDSLGSPRLWARSVSSAFTVFTLLTEQGIGARLVVLPASMLGDPMHPGFLPGYGARIYSRVLKETTLGDTIALVLNIDANPVARKTTLLYPPFLGAALSQPQGINNDYLWSNSAIFISHGFPSAVASLGHGQALLSEDSHLDIERLHEILGLVINWRRLVSNCIEYFYSWVLEKPLPRLRNIVYKLRRVAEKALEENNYVNAISACRVLIEAGYRVNDVVFNDSHMLDTVLFPPLGCFEQGYTECYDILTGAAWRIGGEVDKPYIFMDNYLSEHLETVYEEYYMRGLLAKGSL